LSDIEERIDGLLSPQKVDKNNNIVEEDGDSDFESVLKQISDEINDEDKGLPISDSLAKCMTDIWEKPLSKEKYLEKLKKHKVPQNVNLKLKKCNLIIWNNVLNSRQNT